MSKDLTKKFFGQIRTAIPKEMQGVATFAPIPQPPIEGVKITDGNKNVFSDKDGKFEITTDKKNLIFSKQNYVSQTIDLYAPQSHFRSGIIEVFLEKSGATTNETKTETKTATEEAMLFGFKQKFLVNVALVLGVVGLGWYFYKSKKQ